MYTSYQPASIGHTIIALVFYLLMLGIVVYSFLSLYALNHYGRSKTLTATVSVLYIIILAGLFAAAQSSLNKINF